MTETTIGRVMESTLAVREGFEAGQRELRLREAVKKASRRMISVGCQDAAFEDLRDLGAELMAAYAEARPR